MHHRLVSSFIRLIFFILLFVVSLNGMAQNTLSDAIAEQLQALSKDSCNREALRQLCMYYLNQANFDKSIEYANQLMKIGDEQKDKRCNLYAHICLGQAGVMMDKTNAYMAYVHLKTAETIGMECEADSALCSVYNGLGLYASNIQKDYAGALQYFFKGLDAAKKAQYKRLYGILLCNIAGIYHLQKDVTGITYTQECYDLGHKEHDPYLSYIGAIRTASMLNLKNEYQSALKYAQEAEFLMAQNRFNDESEVYTLFGYTLCNLKREEEAETYFLMALEKREQSKISSILNAYLGYADMLVRHRELDKAIRLLQEGVDYSQNTPSAVYRSDLLLKLSECHEMNGQSAPALACYKQYKVETDSLFNIEKERVANELRIKYQTERAQNEAKQSKLELLEKEKSMQTFFFLFLIVLISFSLLYYLFYKKQKLYKAIVRQNQEAILRERLLKEQIFSMEREKNEILSENISSNKYASSLTEAKKNELFHKLETLMTEQHIYRDNLLTKDKVAELLGSNRTYLSQIINEQTGKSFTQYINDYRIQDAVRLLSDPDNQIPLKTLSVELGFNSSTTFYKQFQAATGMTPSQYRNQVMDMHSY